MFQCCSLCLWHWLTWQSAKLQLSSMTFLWRESLMIHTMAGSWGRAGVMSSARHRAYLDNIGVCVNWRFSTHFVGWQACNKWNSPKQPCIESARKLWPYLWYLMESCNECNALTFVESISPGKDTLLGLPWLPCWQLEVDLRLGITCTNVDVGLVILLGSQPGDLCDLMVLLFFYLFEVGSFFEVVYQCGVIERTFGFWSSRIFELMYKCCKAWKEKTIRHIICWATKLSCWLALLYHVSLERMHFHRKSVSYKQVSPSQVFVAVNHVRCRKCLFVLCVNIFNQYIYI